MVGVFIISAVAIPVAGTPTDVPPENNGSNGNQPTEIPSNSTQGPPEESTETDTATSTPSITESPAAGEGTIDTATEVATESEGDGYFDWTGLLPEFGPKLESSISSIWEVDGDWWDTYKPDFLTE